MIIKKGALVKIISGKDRGKTGEILEINRKLNKIKVKSINMIKRHTKPTKENNKKQTAITTNGTPITLRVASRRINIPIIPSINSIGIVKLSERFILSNIPPLSTNWS